MAKETNNLGIMHNMITQGTTITGTITTDNDIRIDGTVEGDIVCRGKVVVGENGMIHGNVACTNAEIMGSVDGTLRTEELTSLKSTSRLTGDLKTKVLAIEPQATFSGTCEM